MSGLSIKELRLKKADIERSLIKDTRKSLFCSSKYLEEAEKAGSIEHMAHANRFLGYCNRNLGELDLALRFFFKSLRYARRGNLNDLVQPLLNDIGVVYRNKGQYSKALEFYFQALEGENIQTIASTYNNIAVIYYKQKVYEKALAFFKKALELLESSNGSLVGVYVTKANIGDIYYKLNKFSQAEKFYLESLEGGEKFSIAQAKFLSNLGLGRVYLNVNKPERAFEFLEQALALCEEGSASFKRHSVIIELADASHKFGSIGDAERYYQQALSLADTKDSERKLHALSKLHTFYESIDDYYNAYKYFRQWEKLRQKAFSEAKEREITRLQINLETKEKEREIELLRKENELKNLLIEKSKEINRKNKELEEFSYAISHDLKEPVRMMKSFSQLLQKRMKDLGEEETELLNYISDGSTRLVEMIDDLYRYATIGAGDNDMVLLDLNKVLEIVKQNLSLKIRETKTELRISNLPGVRATKNQFVQLFQNLLSNSIKFSKPGQNPIIEVFFEEIDDQHVGIYVKDNGVGIEERHLESIFKIFKRATNSQDIEGSGIGLALCNKIVSEVGGSLSVDSKIGMGSTFLIKLKRVDNMPTL